MEQKIRCGMTIYTRPDDTTEWASKMYQSISQAKKANGLNSRTVRRPQELPAKREAA